MTKIGVWVALLAAAVVVSSASAQVSVEVTQPQDQFLPGEALRVGVRITNLSGQTLHLGEEANWLTFSIEARKGTVVPQVCDLPVVGAFDLPSSKVATKRLDLAPAFPVTGSGRYNIIATVRIKGWNNEISSPPKAFDIVEGVSLWETEFGVPGTAGDASAGPEIRRYILQQANYIRGKILLYLRVTDHTGMKPVRVVPIGPMLSFSRPEHLLDQASNLHVLYQDGPHAYNYSVYTPEGEHPIRQTYDYIASRPRLNRDADGKVVVLGGVRREAATDIPAPKPVDVIQPPTPIDPDLPATSAPPQQ